MLTETTVPVRREITLPTAPEETWDLLVDDEARGSWFGGPTTLDPRPGRAATFTDPDGVRRRGMVDQVEPGRRLAWTWWPEDSCPDEDASRVDVQLEPMPDGGTRVGVTEVAVPRATGSIGRPTARASFSAAPVLAAR